MFAHESDYDGNFKVWYPRFVNTVYKEWVKVKHNYIIIIIIIIM